MEVGETLLVETAEEWRTWLAGHHADRKEIWLISYKKGVARRALDYDSALDQALCFGWIDSRTRAIDAESYATSWSPRRPKGSWTEGNRARARRLIAAGLMTEAGLQTLPADLRLGPCD